MVKQLKSMSGNTSLPDMQSAQMKQDAALMQGVSSRLQIKKDLQAAAARPQEPVKSKSKRLQKPVDDPEFITGNVGYGRTSKSQLQTKSSDFGKQAESAFGYIKQTGSNYNEMDFL